MKPILITALLLAIAALLGTLLFPVDYGVAAIGVALSWFVWGKMTFCLYLMQGHGIFKRRGVWGMNIPLLIGFGVIGFIIAGFTYVVWTMPNDLGESTMMNLKLVSYNMIVGYVAPFVLWAAWLYRFTFYGSEYDARMQFKQRGDTDEAIEEKIGQLYAGGSFGQPA